MRKILYDPNILENLKLEIVEVECEKGS